MNKLTLRMPHQLFIGGTFVDAEGGKTYETINPTDGSVSAGPDPRPPPPSMTSRGPLLSIDTLPCWEAPSPPPHPSNQGPPSPRPSASQALRLLGCGHRASHQSRGSQVHTHTHTF